MGDEDIHWLLERTDAVNIGELSLEHINELIMTQMPYERLDSEAMIVDNFLGEVS